MQRLLLLAIVVSSVVGSVYAFTYTEAEHIGALCTTCHDKFSSRQPFAENFSAPVKSTDVTDMYPCFKKPCHYSSPVKWGGGGNRYSLHMSENICKNCHGINGRFDIHISHTTNGTTVTCSNCHGSIDGWNSTRVEVPPFDDKYVANSSILNTTLRIPQWDGDCGYCHKSIQNATRQHNVHALVIEKACVECHGEIIKTVPNPLEKKGVDEGTGPGVPKEPTFFQILLGEYQQLFENISMKFLDFYKILDA